MKGSLSTTLAFAREGSKRLCHSSGGRLGLVLALLVLLPALELFAATFALLPMNVAFAPQTVGTTSAVPTEITMLFANARPMRAVRELPSSTSW